MECGRWIERCLLTVARPTHVSVRRPRSEDEESFRRCRTPVARGQCLYSREARDADPRNRDIDRAPSRGARLSRRRVLVRSRVSFLSRAFGALGLSRDLKARGLKFCQSCRLAKSARLAKIPASFASLHRVFTYLCLHLCMMRKVAKIRRGFPQTLL